MDFFLLIHVSWIKFYQINMKFLTLYWKCCKNICSFKYFGDLVCSRQCVRRLWSHLILMSTFQWRYYCIHFVDEKLNIIDICIFISHILEINVIRLLLSPIYCKFTNKFHVLNISFWCLWNAWHIVDGQHIFSMCILNHALNYGNKVSGRSLWPHHQLLRTWR